MQWITMTKQKNYNEKKTNYNDKTKKLQWLNNRIQQNYNDKTKEL